MPHFVFSNTLNDFNDKIGIYIFNNDVIWNVLFDSFWLWIHGKCGLSVDKNDVVFIFYLNWRLMKSI